MNRITQNIFLFLYPAYPLLAWGLHFVTTKPPSFLLNIFLLPMALNFLYKGNKLPQYVKFLMMFTGYHLVSAFINNAIPQETNKIYFLLSDSNLLACILLIIVVNTDFSDEFIIKMNRNITILIVLSLFVSILQIKNPDFFTNIDHRNKLEYLEGQDRLNSIYSWTNINSVGITFPLLISIMLNFYSPKSLAFYIVILSGIVVSFLTKGRYVMLSALVVFSQLFFAGHRSFGNKIAFVSIFVASFFLIRFGASQIGYNIDDVVANRILEKETDFASAKTRDLSYKVFLIKFPEHSIFGVGPATRDDVLLLLQGEAPLIHIGFLCYLYYYGVAGCFFIFMAIYFLLRDSWRVGKKTGFWGTFYGLIGFCLANLTFVYFEFSEMGIILGAIYLHYFSTVYSQNPEQETVAV